MVQVTAESRDIFQLEGQYYVRLLIDGEEKILPASLTEVSESSETEEHFSLLLEVDQEHDTPIQGVVQGDKVTLYMLKSGVLYVTQCSLSEVSSDTTLRFEAKVPQQCVGVELRNSQRYAVQSSVRLFQIFSPGGYCQLFPIPLNISLGGFGLEMAEGALVKGKPVTFQFKVYIDTDNEADRDYPALEISGEAKVMTTHKPNVHSPTYFGFAFTKLDPISLESLANWIQTHKRFLRRI